MEALDARAVEEDLEFGARQWQPFDVMRQELERNGGARLPVRRNLVEIGPDRGLDKVPEAAQDAILIEACNLGKTGIDFG